VSIRDSDTPQKEMSKRIASLDFQRGLAIWLMVFVHAAANMYDSSYIINNPDQILSLPISVLILMFGLGFFAIWNSYFLFISSTVNSMAISKRITDGYNPKTVLIKQILSGAALCIANIIDDSFLYQGYFGVAFRTGDWTNTYPLWNGFFSMGTLRIIGWSMIINAVILFFLLRNNGHEKYRRNIIIFSSLALLILILSPFIHYWVDNMPWEIPTTLPPGVNLGPDPTWPSLEFQPLNASFKAWILTIFAGDIEPIFPYLATAFIGAIIGLTLARKNPVKRFPLIGGLSGVGTMGLGGVFIALGFYSLDNTRPPLGNYFLMFGAQICSMFLLLWLVEYRGKSEKFANNVIVKHFRRWGIISLSLYVLQIFELIPRAIIGFFYNLAFNTNINMIQGAVFGIGDEYKVILYAILVMVFWELLVYLWSRINFCLSFEWVIVNLIGLYTKQKSRRLNVKYMLDEVEWIDYKAMLNDISQLKISKITESGA